MHFSNVGIFYLPSGASRMLVVNSNISDCGNGASGAAILASPSSGLTTNVTLDHVRMTDSDVGLWANGTNASPMRVSVSNSLASENVYSGFLASTTSGPLVMMINHSTASNNGTFGIRGNGANATVTFGNSVISGNVTGVKSDNGATVQSYQNNQINQNGTDGTAVAVALH